MNKTIILSLAALVLGYTVGEILYTQELFFFNYLNPYIIGIDNEIASKILYKLVDILRLLLLFTVARLYLEGYEQEKVMLESNKSSRDNNQVSLEDFSFAGNILLIQVISVDLTGRILFNLYAILSQ